MDDLIERENKLARGAGATQRGQYDAANACERPPEETARVEGLGASIDETARAKGAGA